MSAGLLGGLHRHVWQRLPRSARRRLLFSASSLLAPRPDVAPTGGFPLVLAGPLTTASGLGEHSRRCYQAAVEAGLESYGVDLTHTLMQTPDHQGFTWRESPDLSGPGTLLVVVNSPFLPLALMKLGRSVIAGKRIIGYWAWELPQVPSEWTKGLPFVHEIWAPSHFTAEAIRPIAGGRPVRVVPIPIADAPPPVATGQEDGPFTVLVIFNVASSFARKNPLASIRAFRQAFGATLDARLLVKMANAEVFPESRKLIAEAIGDAPNIEVIEASLSPEGLSGLYERADVVMSLHRSEGFGLVPAEAMLRGLPVITTNWSGNTDFCTPETGIPIGYRLIPAEDPQGTYDYPDMVWADPDVDETAAALAKLKAEPALRSKLGADARRFALSAWSGAAFARTVTAAIA